MKHILLVNPFSSSKYLSDRLKDYGVTSTAIYTVDLSSMPGYLIPNNKLFSKQIKTPTNNIDQIVEIIGKNQRFDYVINGLESHTHLSDMLAQHYTPHYANNPQTSELRCDKYKMHQALANYNIPHIKQYVFDYTKSVQPPDLSTLNLSYPCFIKPLASGISIGAHKINNNNEYKQYFTNTAKYKNYCQTQDTRDKFLIAEHVDGIEIFVDTFSVNGKHYIASIQRYHKEKYNNIPICLYVEPEQDKNIINTVKQYINNILNATEFQNGLAHTELFLLPNNDVKLIEINPRISGGSGIANKITMLSKGYDAITLLMKHMFSISQTTLGDNKFYRCLILYNLSGNPLPNLKNHLAKYPNVFEVLQLVPDGHITSLQNKEVSLSDVNAFVILRADNMKDIDTTSKVILTHDQLGWSVSS